MSEIQDTEFAQGWAEGAEESQPQGRSDQAAFEKPDDDGGDEGDAGGPPATTEPPADANRPAAGAENPDEFAGLPEDVVARLKAAEERAAKAENTLRSNEGRYSRTERELNELRGRVIQQKPEPEQPQVEATLILDDDTRAKLAEYDDLGPPIIKAFETLQTRVEKAENLLRQGSTQQAERELAQAEEARGEYLERQATLLNERHPDVGQIVASPAYADWHAVQPNWVKDIVARNGNALVDGEAAAFVFDKFKADTAPKPQPSDPDEARRLAQLAGSADVTIRTPAFTPSDDGAKGDYMAGWREGAEEDKRKAGNGRR